MLNTQVTLKNILLDNVISVFIEAMKKISLEFPRSVIRVGYTETLKNPADYMTKLFTNRSLIVNSNLYIFGDPNTKTVEDLEMDTIARCSKGELEFLGIPDRFLKKVSEDKCFRCLEPTCALVGLVKTCTRENREAMEDKEELEEALKNEPSPNIENIGRSKLRTWNLNIKKRFQIASAECLIDSACKCKFDLTLSKGDYNAALAKHYLLNQLLT